jgi:bifunctional DNA-binding transcriptional regulator/antitoxin component of YhaV-PrlF toxin-antitoxin module
MTHFHDVLQTDARGRLLLPKELRALLGVEGQTAIEVEELADGSVVLRDVREFRRAQLDSVVGSMSGKGGSSYGLIKERRAEAAREAAK